MRPVSMVILPYTRRCPRRLRSLAVPNQMIKFNPRSLVKCLACLLDGSHVPIENGVAHDPENRETKIETGKI